MIDQLRPRGARPTAKGRLARWRAAWVVLFDAAARRSRERNVVKNAYRTAARMKMSAYFDRQLFEALSGKRAC